MKMVRSLLLGSAAGFVAVAGAQAADMPVKAKPVEYVKICTLYGAGFFYLPGTDICVKHGAYVRFQAYYNHGATSATNGPLFQNAIQASNFLNSPNDLLVRSRAVYTLDARTQTEWGTLRAYALIGYTQDWLNYQAVAGNAAALYATRGFIQFAGFTLGKATSFYDIWSVPANSYFAIPSSDTGDAGDIVAAYTFQFGNGISATLSAEDPRRQTVVNTSITAAGVNPFPLGVTNTADMSQVRWPDIVANLRVDQAWGSFQIMGAVHDASGGYFVPSVGVTCNVTAFGGTLTGQLACGHPDDELGWAVGAGGIFKIPMPTGLTDIASFQVNYSEGASRYVAVTQFGVGNPALFGGTSAVLCPTIQPVVGGGLNTPTCLGSVGFGLISDGIYANPGAIPGYDGSVQNTKVWGVNASWDHLWTPNLKTSVYGWFIHTDYNATATALIGTAVCGGLAGTATPIGVVPVGLGTAANSINRVTNCDPDFNWWGVGSRTQWNITSSFYVGFDVLYQKLETSFAGAGFFTAAAGQPRPTGNYELKDQDTVSVTARAHWDILP
ncbi:MAG: porin [Xanthobacteraceae bacterium]